MSAPYAAEPYPGLLLADRFRLLRQLAVGGMGAVWVARHERLGKEVAVKLISPRLLPSEETRIRFEREARAVGQLNSQHVVQIFDCGCEGGLPYIAMELLEGEDLHARLRRRGRLGLTETAAIARQTAKGLRKAHEAGIVHRDLKPANVFLARVDDEEVVKLLDFGVAKLAEGAGEGNATTTGVVVGSPNFMSPEQTRSAKNIDWRSDLWSLGVIVYRAVTGIAPFRGDSATDVLVKICTERAARPTEIQPDLPAALDSFFVRALARELDQRFQSAMELADALDEVVARAVAAGWSPPLALAPPPSPSGPGAGPGVWSSPGMTDGARLGLAAPATASGAGRDPVGGPPTPSAAGSGPGLCGSGGSWPQASWPPAGTPPPALTTGPIATPSNPGTLSRLGMVGLPEAERRRSRARWVVGIAAAMAMLSVGVMGWLLGSTGRPGVVDDGSAGTEPTRAPATAASDAEQGSEPSPGDRTRPIDAGAGAPTALPEPSVGATSTSTTAAASATVTVRRPPPRGPTPSWGF